MASSLVAGNLIKADGTQNGYGCTDAGVPADEVTTGTGGSATYPDISGFSWVSRVRAAEVAGSDGAAITSFAGLESSPKTYTGTGTLKTAGNGINGRNVLRFNGSSDLFSTPTGGASLTGDWYVAAVVRFTSLTGHQNVFSWGDASGTGERRSLFKRNSSNTQEFIGGSADVAGTAVPSAGVAYLMEMRRNGTTVTVYRDGVLIATGTPTLNAYTATAMLLGVNPGSTEFLNGDIAEVLALGSYGTDLQVQAVRAYAQSYYGISVSGYSDATGRYLPKHSGENTLADSPIYVDSAGRIIAGSVYPIYAGNVAGNGLTYPSVYSFYGNLSAVSQASDGEHLLASEGSDNVLALWAKNIQKFSATRFLYPGTGTLGGSEKGASGAAPPLAFPWGGPNGSVYVEVSHFGAGDVWGDLREVQTRNSGGTATLRRRLRDDTRAIEEYDMTATEPSVNGPTPGLVRLTGRPVAAVANNGTLDTNVTTGAGQCGLVVVKDATNSKCAVYRLENATLTSVSADAEFSTTLDNAGTVNVYANSGQIRLQNKTGGSLNLTAAYYGA